MGSYRGAFMTGFICRLCSEHKRVVVHLYSNRAKKMKLLDKMKILPITIKRNDKLPKTVCETCIRDLCKQFELIQQIKSSAAIQIRHTIFHANGNCPITCPFYRVTSEQQTAPTTSNDLPPNS